MDAINQNHGRCPTFDSQLTQLTRPTLLCRCAGRRVALKLGDALKHHRDPMQMLQDESLHYHRLEWAIYKRLNIGGIVTGIPQGLAHSNYTLQIQLFRIATANTANGIH